MVEKRVFKEERNEGKRIYAYVDEPRVISSSEVVQNGRLVEVGQVGHVVDLLKLWRVHLLDDILLDRLLLDIATKNIGLLLLLLFYEQ